MMVATMPVSSVSSSVAAQVTYPVMLNGYLCYSAAEVQAVRQGNSPDSIKPGGGERSDQVGATTSSQQTQQAEQAQQARQAQDQSRLVQNPTYGQNAQVSAEDDARRGSVLDIYA